MIVTPFGELKYGDSKTLQLWMDAHARRHATVAQAANVPGQQSFGTMDGDWFHRHHASHATNAASLGIQSPTSAIGDGWLNAEGFDQWHRIHNLIHLREDQAAGINNG